MVCAPTSHISNVIIFSPEFKRIFTISNIHSARKRLHFNLSALAKIWLDVLLSPLFLVSISDNSASWRFVGTGSSLRRRLAESPASASALPHFALSCLALSCALAMVVFSLAGGIPDICHNHHNCWLCKKNCGNSSSQIVVVYKKDKYQVWPAVTGSPTPKSTDRHPCAEEAAEKKVVQLFVLPLWPSDQLRLSKSEKKDAWTETDIFRFCSISHVRIKLHSFKGVWMR